MTQQPSTTPIEDRFPVIDTLDDGIVELLSRRFEQAREVGRTRHTTGQAPYSAARSREIVDRFVQNCVDRGLNENMARQLISVILAQTIVERFELYQS